MQYVQQRRLLRNSALLLPRYLICVVVAFFVLIPIVTAIIGGFKTNSELNNAPFSLPAIWHWENYSNILVQGTFWPRELEDATYIDGGSQIDFFWRVLLPLARPSLAVIGMLTMVASWNNFLLPLLILNSSQLWTLPLGIMQFQGEHSTDWALVMAFVSITMIPAIIFYLFAERYLIAGLTTGAVKG